MSLLIRVLFLLLTIMIILSQTNLVEVNVGRAWMIGTFLSLFVMWSLSRIRWTPDGVMAFCRSMGVPEIEEYMFSYSWKVDEEQIRTLAKAVWNSGVGVWIDVVKLTPGDEIRPVVRTTVRCVNKVIIFLSPEYTESPNCCVEFWEAMQVKSKVLICILKPMSKAVMEYLEKEKVNICFGFDELIPILHASLEDTSDENSFRWWRNQSIASGGVPETIAPSKKWSIPKFQLWGQFFIPDRSVTCGPAWLAGNCRSAGLSIRLPWYFILSVCAILSSLFDLFIKSFYEDTLHSNLDYLWLLSVAICNLAPFWAIFKLFDTRIFCDACLRPLLASKAIEPGVMIEVIGDETNEMVVALKEFIDILGHTYVASNAPSSPKSKYGLSKKFYMADGLDHRNSISRYASASEDLLTRARSSSKVGRKSVANEIAELKVQVQIMSNYEHRDALFSADILPFDPRKTVFVWMSEADPFQKIKGEKDLIGQRMMRFLCLVSSWEKENLAESIFSAIGVRVVDVLHGLE